MTNKQKTLSEIRNELAFKNACHEDDFMEGFDAGVAEMKKRAQRLIDCIEGVMSCDEEQWTLEQERIGNKAICIMALADYKSLDI